MTTLDNMKTKSPAFLARCHPPSLTNVLVVPVVCLGLQAERAIIEPESLVIGQLNGYGLESISKRWMFDCTRPPPSPT